VKNASYSQAFGNSNKHRRVFDIEYLLHRNLGDIQREPKNIHVGFAEVDETGGNKEIDKLA
jgi:hypothetical protein